MQKRLNRQKMNDKEKNVIPRNYLVTLIDILGQKKCLEGHRSLTETPKGRDLLKTKEGHEKFRKIQDETFGKIIRLREYFEIALRTFGESVLKNSAYNTASRDDKCIIENITSPISYQFVSDTIIIYTPLTSENELEMRYSIAAMISACMNVMLVSFGNGTFFRGGMEFGVGTEFADDNGIYGLALNDTYYLENKIAEYPRIVIGNKLKELIQCKERVTEYSIFLNGVNDRLDDFCNSSITEDKDGKYIVDFLGKTNARLGLESFPEDSKNYIGCGLEHIGSQYTKHLSKGDKKLSSRYELLKNYYFERLGNWGLE